MKDAFAGGFEETLKKMNWPGNDVTLEGALEQEWANGVKRLLDLQEPELKAGDNAEVPTKDEPFVLLPLEVLAKPLELRFKYHFEGDRPTNRLDKVGSRRSSSIMSIANTHSLSIFSPMSWAC